MPSAVYKSLTVTNTYDDNVIDTIMLLGRVANRLNSVKKEGLFLPCMTGSGKDSAIRGKNGKQTGVTRHKTCDGYLLLKRMILMQTLGREKNVL